MAYVMKGDLDSAAGQINAVVTLAPAFRIVTITSYLADVDMLLGQRRFAGNYEARELRERIGAFTAARLLVSAEGRVREPASGAVGRSLVAGSGG